MNKLLVSPAPHIHTKTSTRSLMTDVVIALLPSVIVSVLFYGWPAVIVLASSVIFCTLLEYLITKFLLKRPNTVSDMSAVVTGIILALNLPPTAPWWVAMIGAAVAVGVAKMTFGGLGQNVFNPAITGRVFLLISFPAIAANDFSYLDMLFVNIGGSAGEISAIAILVGFIYMLARKVIRPYITLSILVTVAVFSGIFWLIDPAQYTDPLFNLLTGGVLLGSVFMATDYVTSPMSDKGGIIFGVGIGIITMLIRYFGSYPEGMSFAILIMNATVPLINKFCKQKKYGRA